MDANCDFTVKSGLSPYYTALKLQSCYIAYLGIYRLVIGSVCLFRFTENHHQSHSMPRFNLQCALSCTLCNRLQFSVRPMRA